MKILTIIVVIAVIALIVAVIIEIASGASRLPADLAPHGIKTFNESAKTAPIAPINLAHN